MKLTTIVLLSTTLISFSLHVEAADSSSEAQSTYSSEQEALISKFTKQIPNYRDTSPDLNNIASITQSSDYNAAAIGQIGNHNIASISQSVGNNNVAMIVQNGSNLSGLIFQKGSNNLAIINQR